MAENVVDVLLRARMEASGVEAGVGQIQKSLKGLTLPKGVTDELEKSFSKLTPLLKDYQKQLNKGFSNKKDLQNFNILKEKISETFGEIRSQVQTVNSQEVKLKVDTQEIDKLENKITAKTADLQKALNNVFTKTVNTNNIKEQLDKVIGNTTKAATIKPMADMAKQLFNSQDYAAYNNKIDELKNKILSLKTTKIDLATALGVKDASKNIEAANDKIEKFFNNLKVNEGKVQTIEHLKQELKDLGINLENVKLEALTNGTNEIANIDSLIEQLASSLRETGNAASDAGTDMMRMVDEVNQLKTSTQYFFSLRNMLNLFKRGIREAVDVVKELDAAMTETAVVTDYSVGDMWKKLPEYTANANALGATVKDMYEATTLYYQQGLRTEAAMSIANETMKMARIGGLEAADATDKMTAALRGFNMEINETSAQRVNDVYSNLAAKTASNTEELGTAMQRTASIAASAGMSFEGTAAFLAQAIETTREPAENLGTAMKTIVARFTELKKNPLEIAEVDGEEVDYNKVDAALKSIGVSLKDANGQFRNLDQVFLDISERWDSLSQTQQRYIATTAAGSRQQSRFIAMMSNYERTMQLMDYANNSAGASNEQFGKTMESLEAKLNKLKNAWNEFLMGIMNDTWIKGIVNGTTQALNVVNKLINTLSFGNKGIKSALSIFTAFAGLKSFGRLANIGLGGLAGAIDPNSSIKEGLKNGLSGFRGAGQAKAITNPIVAAIHGLIPHIDKAAQGDIPYKYQQAGNYQGARQQLTGELAKNKGSYTVGGMLDIINANKLNKQQQKDFFQSSPGLKANLTNSLSDLFTKVGMDPKVSKGLIQGFNFGNLALDEVLSTKALTPEQVAKAVFPGVDIKQTPQYRDIQNQVAEAVKTMNLPAEEAAKVSESLFNQKWTTASEKIPEQFLDTFKQMGQELSTTEKFANTVGKVGASLTSAGYSMQMFGAEISKVNPLLGETISSMGSLLTTAGSLANVIPQLLSNPLALAGAVIVGAIAFDKYQSKKIQQAAEEVVNTYQETTKSITEKISSLESAKDTFAELSNGVDRYGNNINLTAEDYERYLETTEDIATLAPELIRGYDAQGRAILATGFAIDDLIAKEEELKKQAVDTFISDSSINKLMGGIQESDAFKKNKLSGLAGDAARGSIEYLQKQTQDIQKALSRAGITNFNEISKQLFGKEVNLINPSQDDLRLVAAHYNDILNLIDSENSELTDRQRKGLQDAFSSLGEGWNDMLAELQPLSQAIGQYLSSEGLDTIGLGLGEEFTASFNKGLESLTMTAAIENWDAATIKNEARVYAEGFKTMTQEGSEYANIMEKVTTEQEKYNDSLGEVDAIDNYKNAIEEYAIELENLADKYDDGTISGQLFANNLREQANSIRNYTTEAIVDLGQALNTLSDEFASARGAEERFKKAIEGGDYYTAAEGYKNIIDTVLDEKNVAGNGSITGWTGAEEILGTKFVDSHNWDQVVDRIKSIAPMFEDGIAGVQKFGDFLVEAAGESGKELKGLGEVLDDGLFHFDFDLEEGELEKFANKLGLSTDALTALIDKSRQFVAWNTSDMPQIRKALEQDGQSMIGQNGKLYTSESSFRSAAKQQGIFGDDYKKTKKDLKKEQNVEFLTVKSLQGGKLDKVLNNIGLTGTDKTLNNTVAALTKMGFELEDQKKILTSDGIKLADGDFSVEDIETAYNEQAYALENPTVSGIANDTGVIASAATAMLASMGILTDEAKAKINQSTSEDNIKGLKQTLNPEGGFADSNSRNAARAAVESQLADYKSTMSLLETGGLTDSAEYISLANAVKELEGALETESSSWNNATSAAQKYVDGIGSTVQEQQFLSNHAIDIQKALQSSDPTTLTNTLQQLQQEGNLSTQTMLDLGASLSHLEGNEVYIQQLNVLMSQYYERIKAARDETYQPFVITSKLKGDDLESYVSSIDNLTFKEREIILSADLYGDEKVTAFIDELNTELEGDNTTKTVLIEATAKIANGDTAGANELLQGVFGDKAQEVESKLEILCSGNVANASEVQQSIESQIQALPIETQIETNVQANVTATYTGEPPKGGNISYSTSVDTNAIDEAATKANNTTATITIDGNADKAKQAAESAKNTIDKKKASITINAEKGSGWNGAGWSIHVSAHKRGRNYSIPAYQSPSFGSAAGGMNIPKAKKSSKRSITALVGEEGFEVGYIPSEQRSVIFGANGPEMTSFPSDTIIYPHNISKDIIRRGKSNHPTANSFEYGTSGGIPTSSSGGGGGSTSSKAVTKAANHVKKKAKEAADAVQKVSVWWENIARKTELSQRIQDNNQKAFEKYLKEMRATLKTTGESLESGGGGGDDYIKSIGETLGYYEAQLEKATKELAELNLGTEAQQKAQQAVAAAKNTKTKKDDKKAAKELTKANKAAYENNEGSAAKISYKKGKKSKEEIVDLSAYIKEENGTFVIDQEAIDKIDNREKAKAIADAANKEIDDRLSKIYKAQDGMEKAEELLEKMGEELYETFFSWENELTKIWNITQKIEQIETNISRAKSYQELLQAQLANGRRTVTYDEETKKASGITDELLNAFKAEMAQTRNDVKSQVDLLGEQRNHLQNLLNIEDERKTLTEVQNKLVENVTAHNLNDTQVAGYEKYASELEQLIDAQAQAWSFMKVNQYSDGTIDVDFNTAAFEEARTNGTITNDMAKAIQDYVKSLVDASKELNSQYETITNKMVEMNNSLQTLQDQWVGYAEELWQISDEQQKKEVDNLKKLSDSLNNTLKNLLDDVKRKIDQRRKQEDNAKTEQDISRKQQRLAALRADTSGGHQVEIAQLQQEIANDQQNYQRTLEDQLLDNLQQQADLAAQQRERQIELQQATIEATNNAAEVNKWMNNPEQYRQEIFEAYKTANEFDKKPETLQQDLIQKFETMFAGLVTNQQEQGSVQAALLDLEKQREDSISALDVIKDSVNSIETPTSMQLEVVNDSKEVIGSTDAKVTEAQKIANAQTVPTTPAEPTVDLDAIRKEYDTFKTNKMKTSKTVKAGKGKLTAEEYKAQVARGTQLGISEYQVAKQLAGNSKDALTWKTILKAAKGAGRDAKTVKSWNPTAAKSSAFYKAFESIFGKWSKYAKGGLADYTGPAWLDGTPSKPELVLNSTDTKNFLALRDVLSSAMNSMNTVSNSYGGDTLYEININVDKIEKDYDVDRVVEKVKKEITKGAGYRNVTQVRNLR